MHSITVVPAPHIKDIRLKTSECSVLEALHPSGNAMVLLLHVLVHHPLGQSCLAMHLRLSTKCWQHIGYGLARLLVVSTANSQNPAYPSHENRHMCITA